MASAQQQQHPDWEWAFIQDITNVLEMEEELADPCLQRTNQRASWKRTFSGLGWSLMRPAYHFVSPHALFGTARGVLA